MEFFTRGSSPPFGILGLAGNLGLVDIPGLLTPVALTAVSTYIIPKQPLIWRIKEIAR